jgi:DNA-binding CsgD family transcriptional regulator
LVNEEKLLREKILRYGQPVLVGRNPELKRLRKLVASANGGMGGALIVSGPAGIGKTALLTAIADEARADGCEVRVVRGNPSEQGIPFGALRQVLEDRSRETADQVSTDDPLVASVLTKVVSATTTPHSAVSVGASLLAHLSLLGEMQTLVLVVDDAHWLDTSSANALLFASRRLLADRVVVLFGVRTQLEVDRATQADASTDPLLTSLDLRGIEELALVPFTERESIELLSFAGIASNRIEAAVARSAGSPLALHELASSERSGFPANATSPAEAFDVSATFDELLASLDPTTKRFCAAASLDDEFALLANVFGSGARACLTQAETAGVLALEGARVVFRHPLIRSSAWSSVSPGERRELHAELAASLSRSTDVDHDDDRIALHLGDSAVGFDEVAAEGLFSFAQRAYYRGCVGEAISAITRAGQLTADREKRANWLLMQAYAHFNAGNSAAARETCELLHRTADGIDLGTNLDALTIGSWKWDIDSRPLVERFHADAKTLMKASPVRAAMLLAETSGLAYLAGDIAQGVKDAEEAIALADGAGDFMAGMIARGNLIWNLVLHSDQSRSHDELGPTRSIMEMAAQSPTYEGVNIAHAVAMIAMIEERWDETERVIHEMAPLARRMGSRLAAVLFSMIESALNFRRGRWQEALAQASDGLVDSAIPAVSLAWGRASTAMITACLGDDEQTRSLASAALVVANAQHLPFVAVWAHAALGQLELGKENPHLALPHLDEAASMAKQIGFREPCFLLWQGDWIDALIDMGKSAQAEAAIRDLHDFAESLQRSWARGVVARSEARLSSSWMYAKARFDDALKHFDALEMPFELARTLLARAQFDSHDKVHDDDQRDIDEAIRLFRRLGAQAWISRVERHAGQKQSNVESRPELAEILTPAEIRVALLIAAGRSSREAAAEVYISVKTVEFHLKSIYSKFGVSSRAEFGAAFTKAFGAQGH